MNGIAGGPPGSWPDAGFLELLNVPVTNVGRPHDRLLVIAFESDLEMQLEDNSDHFECFQIWIAGQPAPWII